MEEYEKGKISITKNTKGITIPSEEERVAMYPLDYEEFRWAMGDTASIPLLKQFFDKRLMLQLYEDLRCNQTLHRPA